MKNKNNLYIALGIGAGVIAYYIFCKKKNNKGLMDVKSDDISADKPTEGEVGSGMPTPMGGGGGGGMPAPMGGGMTTPILTPITTLILPIPRPTPIETFTAPIKGDVIAYSNPIPTPIPRPIPTSTSTIIETKPILTSPISPISTVSTAPVTSLVSPISTVSTAPVTSLVSPIRTVSTAPLTSAKLSFEGMGQQCFEVGECLTDI